MSALGHLIHRSSVARRSYSSFGGGRFFNSSKPPKTPVVAAKNKSNTSESSPKDSATKTSSTTNSVNSSNLNPSSSNAKPPSDATSSQPSTDEGFRQPSMSSSAYLGTHSTNSYHGPFNPHPFVNTKDFKIHQFFSLHRPLLLISNPPSMFTPPPASAPLLRSSSLDSLTSKTIGGDVLSPSPSGVLNLDGTYGYNVNVDEDVETARQLHYVITKNRVGAVAEWETVLKKMGLDMSQDAERVQLREQMDKEWEEVLMDSVKRKRKKKMKKHK